MLELIGYQETEPGHLELLEPIDADKVRVVALDSLIAMVECQVRYIIRRKWFYPGEVRRKWFLFSR